MFGGQDRPRKDNFKGRSGEKRKKQLLSIKERKVDSLNKEIADIRSRYAQVREMFSSLRNRFTAFISNILPLYETGQSPFQ